MTSFSDSMTSLVTPFDSEFNSLSIGAGHVVKILFSTIFENFGYKSRLREKLDLEVAWYSLEK